jgi:hypothetical protein
MSLLFVWALQTQDGSSSAVRACGNADPGDVHHKLCPTTTRPNEAASSNNPKNRNTAATIHPAYRVTRQALSLLQKQTWASRKCSHKLVSSVPTLSQQLSTAWGLQDVPTIAKVLLSLLFHEGIHGATEAPF